MKKKKDQKKKIKRIVIIIVIFILCAVAGYFGAELLDRSGAKMDPPHLILTLITFYAGYFIGMIIHESGHLVMGLLSGYRFVSFRIGSFTLIKQDGKLVRKKFAIPGTGGQCLMTHDIVDSPDKVPFFRYHFGGGFFNLLTAAAALAVWCFSDNDIVHFITMTLVVVWTATGLINLIPLNLGVPNDGMNILRQIRDPKVRLVMLNMLIFNGMQYEGRQMEDIPESLFEYEDVNGKSPLCDLAIMKTALYIYRRDFTAAHERLEAIANNERLAKVYLNEVKCELLYCKIMLGKDRSEIDELYDKELQAYIKATQKFMVTRRRLMYAYYTLCEKDAEKAKLELEEAEKLSSVYPCKTEYDCEMKLIEYIGNL